MTFDEELTSRLAAARQVESEAHERACASTRLESELRQEVVLSLKSAVAALKARRVPTMPIYLRHRGNVQPVSQAMGGAAKASRLDSRQYVRADDDDSGAGETCNRRPFDVWLAEKVALTVAG